MKTTKITKTFLALIVAGAYSIFQVHGQHFMLVDNTPFPLGVNVIPVVTGNNGNDNTFSYSIIQDNGAGVGIGTAPGGYKLNVAGTIYNQGYSIITTGHNNNNGGITNTGAISGATTISASGTITSSGHNNNNGGITNAGAISGITSLSSSGAISGTTITGSGAITGGTGIFNTKVGINASSPLSPLSIGSSGLSNWSAYVYNPGTTSSQGVIYATSPAPTGGGNYYGITGSVPNGLGNTYGVAGSASSTSVVGTSTAMGVYGYAKNGANGLTYGVVGLVDGSSGGAGVLGAVGSLPSGVSVGSGQYAGYFYGQILTTNDSPIKPNSGSWTGYSDKRLKKDIIPFTDGLEVLRKVNPISYKFNGIGNLPTTKTNIGVVAQDIQKVAPYCVGTSKLIVDHVDAQNFSADIVKSLPADSSGKAHDVVQALTYNQDGLIYVLINSVKQLDSTVTALQAQVAKCCPQGAAPLLRIAAPSTDVELAGNSAILYQNTPNPFGDGTVVKYFVPENTIGASMIFYDEFGSQIKNVEITNTGVTAELNLSTMNLAAGVYSYSLIINNKVVDTKKMMKAK